MHLEVVENGRLACIVWLVYIIFFEAIIVLWRSKVIELH